MTNFWTGVICGFIISLCLAMILFAVVAHKIDDMTVQISSVEQRVERVEQSQQTWDRIVETATSRWSSNK